jgi:polysaccharide export outer membrane protein
LLAALIVAGLLAGCSSQGYPPAPPASGQQAWNYLIGPGDSLQVFVWRNTDLSGTFPVRPDGMMTMSLVEDLPAAGKTPSQLARDVEKSLSKYIQDPIVTIVVLGATGGGAGASSAIGPYDQQIRVIGEAARPQALNYREHMSLVDVLIQVGGLTEFAAGNKAYLLRSIDGKQDRFGVRLEDLAKGGDIGANVEVRPGDVLVIPESLF